MPVTFPATPLTCTVQVALGADLTQNPSSWVWTDITQYVRFAQGISQTVGRPDESSVVNPSKGTLTLDNTDGRFTRRNPLGAYYGQLGYNTPIKATIDPGTGAVTRLAMFVNEWPTRWDRSARDATVPIVCAGKLRQLTQGKQRTRSPMRRTIESLAPVAYWPMEDGSNATAAASALTGGTTLAPAGVVKFGTTTPAGSSSGVDLSGGGSLSGSTGQASGNAVSSWEFQAVVRFHTVPTGSSGALGVNSENGLITFVLPSATWPNIQLVTNYAGGGVTNFGATAFSSAALDSTVIAADTDYHIRLVVTSNPPNHNFDFYVNGVHTGAWTGSLVGSGTLFAPVAVVFNPALVSPNIIGSNPSAVYQAALWTSTLSSPIVYQGVNGYDGEAATTRLYRVAAEAGILMAGSAGASVAMGPQPTGTDLDVLRDCEKVDGGAIVETNWGLGYNSAVFYYDDSVALSLDFAAGHIAEEPKPADDDQRLRNKWSVGRNGGSEATVALVKSPTSGSLYTDPGGPGVYEDDIPSLNVATDGQLPHEASWRVHIGTVDEDRWPSMKLRLHGTPALISSWLAMVLGNRYQAVNVPSQGATYPVDEILEGYTERWDPLSWDVDMFGSPSAIWEVFQIETGAGNRSRIAAGVSTTAAPYGPGVASLSVVSAVSPWIDSGTYPAMFPFVIVIAGEVMTCTAIAGTGLTQTFTVTRALYGTAKTLPSGSQVQLFRPAAIAK